eukprot:CAMPEP_0115107030 /NCGR_PEP_ID=MMETSP0227-20121206/37053_1 /TAXON_ID=89957 /ORGANISM="Polarella glacialis, Strain CCMP 1383" /LENGTH=188 /DNA_ID=CAMNT_0002504831 /DNA_START=67 /DNA_END=630 /DNA_ORIENTATION=+
MMWPGMMGGNNNWGNTDWNAGFGGCGGQGAAWMQQMQQMQAGMNFGATGCGGSSSSASTTKLPAAFASAASVGAIPAASSKASGAPPRVPPKAPGSSADKSGDPSGVIACRMGPNGAIEVIKGKAAQSMLTDDWAEFSKLEREADPADDYPQVVSGVAGVTKAIKEDAVLKLFVPVSSAEAESMARQV